MSPFIIPLPFPHQPSFLTLLTPFSNSSLLTSAFFFYSPHPPSLGCSLFIRFFFPFPETSLFLLIAFPSFAGTLWQFNPGTSGCSVGSLKSTTAPETHRAAHECVCVRVCAFFCWTDASWPAVQQAVLMKWSRAPLRPIWACIKSESTQRLTKQ